MTTTDRIVALDYLRGAALLGILIANLPGFALPQSAYFSPVSAGGTTVADIAAWALTFVVVEGKMRGLFATLFGASMLLVIERADAAGANGAAVHLRRMGTLFLIGCAHLYLVWQGDILQQYALVGIIALPFVVAPMRMLLLGAIAATIVATADGLGLVAMAGSASTRSALEQVFGQPPAALLAREIAAYRGSWGDAVAWRWSENAGPLAGLLANGPETLGYILFGMAGMRSGFLTGGWPRRRYAWLAAVTLGITLPLYAAMAWRTIAHGFDVAEVVLAAFALSSALRPLTVAGYAALLMLLLDPRGGWSTRVAAAGRMALSNYLACSLLFTALFYGWGGGQFAQWSRASLYLLVPVGWVAMLGWSRWWLTRFGHGPAEWVWRCAAQGRVIRLRRRS